MNAPFQAKIEFEAADDAAFLDTDGDDEALILDLDGYEGPLHVLLNLAQSQKVDLLKLSVTRLAEQYLAFIREARKRRFALAADYLVMAAWLAYLKSRLLLPRTHDADADERPAEEIAAQLAFRLAKLDAMRRSVDTLNARPILKREVFTRGDPQATTVVSHRCLEGDLYGLMAAYIDQRKHLSARRYALAPPVSFRLDEARDHVLRLLASLQDWTALRRVAPSRQADGPSEASYLASTLCACLELVREEALEARQLDDFAEIFLRVREART